MKIAEESINPFFLKEYVTLYNWDDGFSLPIAVADNQYCDLGTALILFWLSEAMCHYLGESQRNDCNIEWSNFCEMLTKRLLSGHYKHGPVSFNPKEFNINRVSEYKYNKSGVPKVLYKEVVGV